MQESIDGIAIPDSRLAREITGLAHQLLQRHPPLGLARLRRASRPPTFPFLNRGTRSCVSAHFTGVR